MAPKILIVDDDREFLRMMEVVLGDAGFQVVTTSSGQAALEILRRDRPDVLILDLRMPDPSGWEIYEQVRRGADPALARLPIIITSAAGPELAELHERVGGAPNTYVLAKPFEIDELMARLAEAVDASQRLRGQ